MVIKEKEVSREVVLSMFNSLPKDEKFELISVLSKRLVNKRNIPVSAFRSDLSCLEVVVKYLREELGLKFSKIGRLLNRSVKTIWATYSNSKKKFSGRLDVKSKESIPVNVFVDRKLSVLESIVKFLHEHYGFDYKEISVRLCRSHSTILTIAFRLRKKGEIE